MRVRIAAQLNFDQPRIGKRYGEETNSSQGAEGLEAQAVRQGHRAAVRRKSGEEEATDDACSGKEEANAHVEAKFGTARQGRRQRDGCGRYVSGIRGRCVRGANAHRVIRR